jgi:CheY-like chemotaxis protein
MAAVQPAFRPSGKDGSAALPERGAKAKILVIDDDERNLVAIRSTLEDLAEVVLASSGEEGLRALLHEDFAVILLDVIMPGLDGYETAKLIRRRESRKERRSCFYPPSTRTRRI